MSEAYSTLASFYDLCMEVDYDEWVSYLLALCHRHQHIPGSIVDLGCGTGNLTIPLAKQGYKLTGVDLSPAMVDVARRKAAEARLQTKFFVGDLRDFYRPEKAFDTVISGCDVLNYLTTEHDLKRAFESVYKLLSPGGSWLFDLNSTQKLTKVYGDQFYADLQDDFGYFWDNSYDEAKEIVTMDLTFFVRVEEGLYARRQEQHKQKLWTPRQIESLAQETGFTYSCYDFLTIDSCSSNSERWQFVLQKKVKKHR